MGLGQFFRRHLGWDIGRDARPGADGRDTGKPEGGTPPLSGDTSWAVGDLAECVVSGPWWQCAGPMTWSLSTGPQLLDVNKVIGVEPGVDPQTGKPILFLRFAAWCGRYGSTSFRKILPVADAAERADPAFVDDLRRALPAPGPAPVVPDLVPAEGGAA